MQAHLSGPQLDLRRLNPELDKVCQEYLERYQGLLQESVERGLTGVSVARRHAQVLDGLLSSLYAAARAVLVKRNAMPGRLCLSATGGYGRGLLGVHSDVDLLFVCDDPDNPLVQEIAEGVLYPLWDSGMEVGHAVRSVDDTLRLAEEDIRTATTLLDVRPVAGDAALVTELVRESRSRIFDGDWISFVEALEYDTRQRHERFGDSHYLLEPHIKMGRGGLRDVEAARWIASARWGVLAGKQEYGSEALSARELAALANAEELLWRIRHFLHLRAGRKQDRLSFEDQEEIASQLGFVDGVTLAVEQFMQAYYRHAGLVAQTMERVADRARQAPASAPSDPQELQAGIVSVEGVLRLRDAALLESDPELALRLYEEVIRSGKRPCASARDAIARACEDESWCERLRQSPSAAKRFLGLLSHVDDAPVRRGSVLGELQELGVMVAMIPEFGPLTGRVQHDVYHIYTVDVHSVAAVDRLRQLLRGDLASEQAFATHVALEASQLVPLFLAVLLHDVGKSRGRDHSRTGALMARHIGERLGLSEIDNEHVVWLVREHLSLYHWAMRRDIHDPETVVEVTRQVETLERLRDLYLLTVVDLSTTNPTAMSSWKSRMLQELYLSVAASLEGRDDVLGSRAALMRRELSERSGAEALKRFFESMPDRYFVAHDADSIVMHAQLSAARHAKGRNVEVHLEERKEEESFDLVFVVDDRPGLLSDLAAVLTAYRLEVRSAQIYTRRLSSGGDEAIDIFSVRAADNFRAGATQLAEKLRSDVEALLAGQITHSQLASRRPRPPSWARKKVPEVRTEVTVDSETSPTYTLVDVFTHDRPGLLYTIARCLYEEGFTIAFSKVNTEGFRVADAFYVLDAKGAKVSDAEAVEALRTTLLQRLDAFQEQARRED